MVFCMWNIENLMNTNIFKVSQVVYIEALTRMTGVLPYAGNLEVGEECGHLLLRHHLALVCYRYLERLLYP